jgi:hypothetical protein
MTGTSPQVGDVGPEGNIEYTKNEKGWWGELCAFRAILQIMYALLHVHPQHSLVNRGDKAAVYEKPGDPNVWGVHWIAPARHHRDRDDYGWRPDFVVICNNTVIVAVEVKNWDAKRGISTDQVMGQMIKRFTSTHISVQSVLLTTCTNFWKSDEVKSWFKAVGIDVRHINNRPLPHLDPAPTIEEMRHVLEEYITLESLTNSLYETFDQVRAGNPEQETRQYRTMIPRRQDSG